MDRELVLRHGNTYTFNKLKRRINLNIQINRKSIFARFIDTSVISINGHTMRYAFFTGNSGVLESSISIGRGSGHIYIGHDFIYDSKKDSQIRLHTNKKYSFVFAYGDGKEIEPAKEFIFKHVNY